MFGSVSTAITKTKCVFFYTSKHIVGKVWVPKRVFLRKGRQFGSNVKPRLFRIPGPVFVAVKHCMMDLC